MSNRRRENPLDNWVPKTELGKLVLEGQVSSIYEIFEEGYKIKEVEIIDALVPNLKDDVININQKTLFFLSQAVAKVLIKQGDGGKIINIASMLSFQGGILVPSYTASKSAVMGLTRLMANELAAHNINVNAIAPGYMATDNTAPLRADPVRNKAILGRIPAGRWGEPSDLKGTVVFLASDASSYMQGYTVAVDGGWLSR